MEIEQFYIEQIRLRNFRGFEEKAFTFNPSFTVFIGANGTGKTSVLEGLCVALGGWIKDLIDSPSDYRNIRKHDVRTIKSVVSAKMLLKQYPVEVSCAAKIDGRTIEWTRELDERGAKKTRHRKELVEITKRLHQRINTALDQDIILPVIAYYSCLRSAKERAVPKNIDSTPRVHGYAGSLISETNYFRMLKFIQELRYEYLEDPENTPLYDLLMKVLSQTVESAAGPGSKVGFRLKHGELILETKDGHLI